MAVLPWPPVLARERAILLIGHPAHELGPELAVLLRLGHPRAPSIFPESESSPLLSGPVMPEPKGAALLGSPLGYGRQGVLSGVLGTIGRAVSARCRQIQRRTFPNRPRPLRPLLAHDKAAGKLVGSDRGDEPGVAGGPEIAALHG